MASFSFLDDSTQYPSFIHYKHYKGLAPHWALWDITKCEIMFNVDSDTAIAKLAAMRGMVLFQVRNLLEARNKATRSQNLIGKWLCFDGTKADEWRAKRLSNRRGEWNWPHKATARLIIWTERQLSVWQTAVFTEAFERDWRTKLLFSISFEGKSLFHSLLSAASDTSSAKRIRENMRDCEI